MPLFADDLGGDGTRVVAVPVDPTQPTEALGPELHPAVVQLTVLEVVEILL